MAISSTDTAAHLLVLVFTALPEPRQEELIGILEEMLREEELCEPE